MPYIFEYINTEQFDEENKMITIKCENFLYHIRCFQNIIQYIHGEHPDSYNSRIEVTEEEKIAHDLREEEFNGDHSILQGYIDSL